MFMLVPNLINTAAFKRKNMACEMWIFHCWSANRLKNSLHIFLKTFSDYEFLISKGISFQSFEPDTDIDFCSTVRLVLWIKRQSVVAALVLWEWIVLLLEYISLNWSGIRPFMALNKNIPRSSEKSCLTLSHPSWFKIFWWSPMSSNHLLQIILAALFYNVCNLSFKVSLHCPHTMSQYLKWGSTRFMYKVVKDSWKLTSWALYM